MRLFSPTTRSTLLYIADLVNDLSGQDGLEGDLGGGRQESQGKTRVLGRFSFHKLTLIRSGSRAKTGKHEQRARSTHIAAKPAILILPWFLLRS